MHRKFRRALKNLKQVYNFPNPTREDAFFQRLEEKKETKRKPMFLGLFRNSARIFQIASVCTVLLIAVGGYGVYQNYRSSRNSVPIEHFVSMTEASGESTSDFSDSVEKETQSTSIQTSDEASFSITTAPLSSVPQEMPTAIHPMETVQTRPPQMTTAAVTEEELHTITQTIRTTTTVSVTTEATDRYTAQSTASTAKQSTATTKRITTETTTKVISTPPVSSDTVPVIPPEDNGFESEVGADYRITPIYQYEKTDHILEIGDFQEPAGCEPPTDGLEIFLWWEQCADLSDLVVSGTVLSRIYTRVGNTLWTQVDLEITEVYKGALHPGDKISIYERGGCIPLSEFLILYPEYTDRFDETEEIQNITFVDSGEQLTASIPGESCLYFLQEGSVYVPAGAYIYAGNADDSRYRQNGSSFENVLYENVYFSVDELLAYLQDE